MKRVKPGGLPELVENFDRLPDSAFVKLPVVQALNGNASPASVWRWSRNGVLPEWEKIGPRSTGWNVGKLRAKRAKVV